MATARSIDGLVRDGLWDPYNDYAMGNAADATAEHYGITREEQDAFARQSYERSAAAAQAGKKKEEIVPVTVTVRGQDTIVSDDEEYTKVQFERFASLKPAFTKTGTVTAANASTLNDGAAAVLLMSREKAAELGIKPLALIRGFAEPSRRRSGSLPPPPWPSRRR